MTLVIIDIRSCGQMRHTIRRKTMVRLVEKFGESMPIHEIAALYVIQKVFGKRASLESKEGWRREGVVPYYRAEGVILNDEEIIRNQVAVCVC